MAEAFNTTGGTLNNIFNWTINSGATVDMGTSAFVNGGTFSLVSGATMNVGSEDGLVTGTTNGNVRVSSTRTYAGNILYNGTAAQDLGNEWASGADLFDKLVNLEIANSSGVTLGADIDINGNMTLTTGTLSAGANNDINIDGNWDASGGGVFSAAAGKVVFDGTTQSVDGGGETFNDIDLANGTDVTFSNDLSLTGD